MGHRTANEKLRDLAVRRQIALQRFSSAVQKEVLRLLNATEADLKALIERKGRMLEGRDPSDVASLRRLRALLKSIREMRADAIRGAMEQVGERMKELAVDEARFSAALMSASSPVVLDVVMPSLPLLKALVTKNPFQGKVLSQWASKLAADDAARILDQIKIAMVQGETVQQMTRRVVGAVSFRGADGVTETTRRGAVSVVRTAANFYSNQARAMVMEANADILKEELYVATLDSRTTPICASLDGKRFPIGEGPRPPLHFNCRSTRVPVLSKETPGDRPFKSATEKQLLDEFAEKEGFDRVSSRDALPHGTKGAFDDFARRRARELTGTVPAATTYQEFLSRQPAAFQDDVLGKTKGALFRKGGLKLDRFVNRKGDELTLRELALRDRQAFKDAGLDPDEFLR